MHTGQLRLGKPVENLFALVETVLFRDSLHGTRGEPARGARRGQGTERDAAQASPAVQPRDCYGLLDKLEDWLARGRQREVDRYLARATDVYDLERRIRAMERAPHFGFDS